MSWIKWDANIGVARTTQVSRGGTDLVNRRDWEDKPTDDEEHGVNGIDAFL